jgi:hypothetical protein
LLDNVSGHPSNIGEIRMTADVKVEYLPPNTTSFYN